MHHGCDPRHPLQAGTLLPPEVQVSELGHELGARVDVQAFHERRDTLLQPGLGHANTRSNLRVCLAGHYLVRDPPFVGGQFGSLAPGAGRGGAIFWVRPQDVTRTAKLLGV